jgi:hypothetical protein
MNDLFIQVRGINIPKHEVESVEQRFGAKLVSDDEPYLLVTLDTVLAKYKLENGREPDMVDLHTHPGEWFKHMPLTVDFMNQKLDVTHKPAWFRFKKIFGGYDPNLGRASRVS